MKTNKQTNPKHVSAFAVQIKCDKTQQRRISHSQHRIILKSRRLNCDKYIPYVLYQEQALQRFCFSYKLTVLDIMKHVLFETPVNTNV